MVEKEVAKTKRETAKLQVREKRKLRDSKESRKKRPRVNSAVFTDLCCVCYPHAQGNVIGSVRIYIYMCVYKKNCNRAN